MSGLQTALEAAVCCSTNFAKGGPIQERGSLHTLLPILSKMWVENSQPIHKVKLKIPGYQQKSGTS